MLLLADSLYVSRRPSKTDVIFQVTSKKTRSSLQQKIPSTHETYSVCVCVFNVHKIFIWLQDKHGALNKGENSTTYKHVVAVAILVTYLLNNITPPCKRTIGSARGCVCVCVWFRGYDFYTIQLKHTTWEASGSNGGRRMHVAASNLVVTRSNSEA
jgi:hypothetical protein